MIYTVFVKVVIKHSLAGCAHAYGVSSNYIWVPSLYRIAVRSGKGAGKSTWGPQAGAPA